MNLKSVFLCSQAVLPTMVAAKYGKIVSISSIYGFTGNATRASYATAKAGIAVFTKSLALEHVKDGLNINAIAPGRIKTDKSAAITATKPGPPPKRRSPWAAPAPRKTSPAPRRSWSTMKTNTSPARPFMLTASLV